MLEESSLREKFVMAGLTPSSCVSGTLLAWAILLKVSPGFTV